MQEGFLYAHSFSKTYDETYYTVRFSWIYSDGQNNEDYEFYMPAVYWSTDHFSSDVLNRMQNYRLASGLICPDVSNLTTQIKMIGDREGSTAYSRYESTVTYWLFENDCKEINHVQTYVDDMEIRYLTSNTYYDYEFITNPIPSYIWYSDKIIYSFGIQNLAELRVVPSYIQFINGSTSMLYETKESPITIDPSTSNSILYLSVRIEPQYYASYEYFDYQPQFNNSIRQLEDSIEVSFDSSYNNVLLILYLWIDY